MKLNRLLLTILLISSLKFIHAQSLADCNNLSLNIDTVYLFPGMDTIVTGDLYYNDTTFTVYPTLLVLLPENPYIESNDLMVLSSLDSGSVQWFELEITFINTDFPNNTVIPALFHIYDSDWVGDSIVTCYIPLTLVLQNETEVINANLKNNVMQVYPNPATENLHICMDPEFINQKIQIMNYSGQILTTLSGQPDLNISLTSYPSGIYYVRLENSGIVKSFVKE